MRSGKFLAVNNPCESPGLTKPPDWSNLVVPCCQDGIPQGGFKMDDQGHQRRC